MIFFIVGFGLVLIGLVAMSAREWNRMTAEERQMAQLNESIDVIVEVHRG